MSIESITHDGGTLAVEVTGADNAVTPSRPLVVLAHGMGDDRRAYRFVAPALVREGYRVAAVDLRGSGDSSVDWDDFSRTAIAGDLVAVTRQLLAGEPDGARAVLVGHSISGGAATIAAATAPELVASLVEIAPFTRKQSVSLASLRDRDFRRGMRHLLATAMRGSVDSWVKYLDVAYPEGADATRPADHDARIAEIRATLAEPGRMAALKKMGSTTPADAGARLGDVRVPVLVVEGEEDPDWADPRAEGEKVLADLTSSPLARLEVIPGSGHYPHVQHAEEVTRLITAFIAETAGAASDGTDR